MRFLLLFLLVCFFACGMPETETSVEEATPSETSTKTDDFQWQTESFADLGILRYQIPGFEKLSLQQKKLVYYLTEAGLAGRDIMYDQNYRHNLSIRRALERVIQNYKGDKSTDDWKALLTYAKRVWFSNGIHHHYSMDKFKPAFSKDFLMSALKDSKVNLSEEAIAAIFDPQLDAKKVNLDPKKDLVKGSAVNFYDTDITAKEVEDYYKTKADKSAEPISVGLNTKVVRNKKGELEEKVWHANGMYADAIKKIVAWLEKAAGVG